uniref:SUEL-type lectin domain-containing protein n=1 Tax=Macrostomum lignano TaxID=282301 RepID=A0A1I8JML5_9PLAT
CPPKRVKKVGGCEDRIQRWLTVYFEWNKLKGRCVKKFRAREKPCREAASGSTGAAKSKKCPKRRVMEPGPCIDGSRKVLVEHYEYSEKRGRCIAHRDFMHQKCGEKAKKKKKKSTPGVDLKHECPEKTVNQGACRKGGYRTVNTVYFVFVKALGRCVRKVKQEDEKCALLVKNKSCPADVTQEVGPCVNGYRTNIVYTFKRDLEGRCEKKSKKITITCSDEKAKVCPPKRVKKVGGCEDRIQRWLTVYFEWNKLKGRCVKKFRAREKPCREAASGSTGAAKSKKCPKRRVMEPGPCIDGSRKVLVEHYEYSEKRGRCIAHRDFMHQKCGEKAKKKKKKSTPGVDLKHECPEKTVNQGACRKGGYRTVSTVYFVFVKALGRCVRKVKQEDEKCALLVKNKSCPADVTQEVGPCVNGYRTNIVYTFKRDLEGRCEKKSKKITITCSDEKAKGKKCPKRRVMEPGPCIDGSRKVLVEHYEYSEKRGRCIAHRDFMHQKCGEKAKKKKKKSTPGVDLKHECPEKTVNQGACRKGGYRTVSTVYFVFVKALGRCVRKVKQEDEKCALLVKLASCPKDDVVETGPCHRGFRTNIIYQYTRDLEGRCARAEKSVTEECKGSTADCLPPSRKLAKPCSASGFERWLTTYYVYNKLKKRCVRKLRVKEVSCHRVKKCPTPRVIEPSPCSKGKQRLLIEHYELDAKLGRCRMKQDYVNRKCGKPTKRQAAAAKHHCPDSTYHQKPCRKDGYRSVLKIYYRYNSAKGRCVRNVRVDDEKCSRLVATRATCKADEMVEEGPCKKGFRENIIYRYERNKDGSCVRKERRVSLACVEKKVVP